MAEAIARAVMDDRAAGRIYNVAEPEAIPEADWVRAIGRAAGWSGRIVTVPAECLPESMHSNNRFEQHWVVDTNRIRQELGYREPVPFEAGLHRAVEWARAHPPREIDPAQFDYAAEDAVLARL